MRIISGGSSPTDLRDIAVSLADSGSAWEKDVGLFLKEWLNEADHITVQTSGSTGTPKEIQLRKSHVLASAEKTCEFFDIGIQSTLLLCMSAKYIAGKLMIVRALHAGAKLIVTEPSSNPLSEIDESIDFAAMVPLQVEACLRESLDRFKNIRTLIIGGAQLNPGLREQLEQLEGNYFCTYGMTETITHVGVSQIGKHAIHEYEAISPNTFSQDERGCLSILMPHMDDQEVVTNDLIQLHSSTSFEWLGRIDNVINTGGVKVYPERIEEKLAGVINGPFFITGTEDESLGQAVTLVHTTDQKIPDSDQLRTMVEKYELPRKFIQVDEIKMTGSGKIDKIATLTS